MPKFIQKRQAVEQNEKNLAELVKYLKKKTDKGYLNRKLYMERHFSRNPKMVQSTTSFTTNTQENYKKLG